jgi:lysophospholipase L1-like esterase
LFPAPPNRLVSTIKGVGMSAIYTFGDSILDCGRYNQLGVTPAKLLACNDDELFPEFRGRDLCTRSGESVTLIERAVDGSKVDDLPRQLARTLLPDDAVTLLTVGGNDLLQGLMVGDDRAFASFQRAVRRTVRRLKHTRLFVGNVYDPSFGDDARNFVGVDPTIARRSHGRVNRILAAEAACAGATLVDLHAHFLNGDSSWFTSVIEPSLVGASEIRRAMLVAWEAGGGA